MRFIFYFDSCEPYQVIESRDHIIFIAKMIRWSGDI